MTDPVVRGVDHVGLTVPDLNAATRFFAEAFGAQVLYDTHLPGDPPQRGPDAEARLGLNSGEAMVAIRALRLGNGAGLELFAVTGGSAAPPAGLGHLGLTHVGLYCDDVDAALARVRAAGGTPLAGPNDLPGPEAGAGNRMNYVRTPWGMLIELIAYPAGVAAPNGIARWTPARS